MVPESPIFSCLCDKVNVPLSFEAAELIISIAKVISPSDIQSFEIEKRNKAIRKMKEQGLSIRQIERLTGVSFGIIRGI